MKKKSIITLFISIIFMFIFVHSSPERVIRLNLICNGYVIDAFKTDIYLSTEDAPWHGKYYCKNPSIGLDFYSVKKGFLNLWFIDNKNSGGC